jgi:hypothetical protein
METTIIQLCRNPQWLICVACKIQRIEFVNLCGGLVDMNQRESSGVVLVGIGCIGGAYATVQDIQISVLASVFTVLIGIAVVLWGRYG